MSRANEYCISSTSGKGRSIAHHMCRIGPDSTISINGKPTGCTTFRSLLQLLSSAQPWFATALRQGIPKNGEIQVTVEKQIEMPSLQNCQYYHGNGSSASAASTIRSVNF
jgi:hypothetical protein